MKTKNVCMQLFVLTPLTLLHTSIGTTILLFILSRAGLSAVSSVVGGLESLESLPTGSLIFTAIIIIAIFIAISKAIISLKGHETEYSYWDDVFEFEGDLDESNHKITNIRKVRGGWSRATRWWFVLLVILISPITFILQLISLVFMIISFFSRHILSFYGAIPYEYCKYPGLQKVIHFLFGFVVVTKKQRATIVDKNK